MNNEPLPPYLYITVCSAREVTEAYVFPDQESEKTYKGTIKIVDGGTHPKFRILNTYGGPLNGVVIDFELDEILIARPEEILDKLEERRKIYPYVYNSKIISQIKKTLEAASKN